MFRIKTVGIALFFLLLLATLRLTPVGAQQPSLSATLAKTSQHAATLCPGGVITYTITLNNTSPRSSGPHTASIRDVLPAGLNYVNNSAAGGATYNSSERRIEWDGRLLGGESAVISFGARVGNSAASGVTFTNVATAMLSDAAGGSAQTSATASDLVNCPTPTPTRTPTPTPTRPIIVVPTNTPTPTATPTPRVITAPTSTPTLPVIINPPTATPTPKSLIFPYDVAVTGIEVTQGMQNLKVLMPLIKQRNTIVRVYVKNVGGPATLVGVKARLRVMERTPGNQLIELGFLYPKNKPQIRANGGDRLNMNHSYWFEFPAAWMKNVVRFWAELNYDGAMPEVKTDDNHLWMERAFVAADPIDMRLVPVRTWPDGDITKPSVVQKCQGDPGCAPILAGVLRYHPTGALSWQEMATTLQPSDPNRAWDIKKNVDRTEINIYLGFMKALNQLMNFGNNGQAAWYGMVTPNQGRTYGWANYGVAHGTMTNVTTTGAPWANVGSMIIGHELGHNRGLGHVSCAGDANNNGELDEDEAGSIDWSYPWSYQEDAMGNPTAACSIAEIDPKGYYGVDVYWKETGLTEPIVISNDPAASLPNQAFPLMGYKAVNYISPWEFCKMMPQYDVACTWGNIDGNLQAAAVEAVGSGPAWPLQHPSQLPETPAARTDEGAASTATREHILLAVSVDASAHTATFYPMRRLAGLAPQVVADLETRRHGPAAQSPHHDSEAHGWVVTLEDASGAILTSYPIGFDLVPSHIENPGGLSHLGGLVDTVPFPPGAHFIRVRHQDAIVATKVISANAPTVQLLAPQSGVLQAGAVVSWQGADLDGDALAYTLLYSPDNGLSWMPVVLETLSTQVALTAEMLHDMPGSSQGKLKIMATDGVNTAEDISEGLFTEAGSAPDVTIYSPGAGAASPQGTVISFLVNASDVEDGALSDSAVTWQSDRDGVLGTGSGLATDQLTPGRHVITAVAVDSDEMMAQDSVEVIITQENLFLPIMMRVR